MRRCQLCTPATSESHAGVAGSCPASDSSLRAMNSGRCGRRDLCNAAPKSWMLHQLSGRDGVGRIGRIEDEPETGSRERRTR